MHLVSPPGGWNETHRRTTDFDLEASPNPSPPRPYHNHPRLALHVVWNELTAAAMLAANAAILAR